MHASVWMQQQSRSTHWLFWKMEKWLQSTVSWLLMITAYIVRDYTLLPRTSQKKSEQELEAQKYDLTHVELDPEGDIGTLAGGAGIGMATMDTIKHYGGTVNNFLDLGGGVTAEKTYQAMKILLQNEQTDYVICKCIRWNQQLRRYGRRYQPRIYRVKEHQAGCS